ncbi:MAG: cytochrome-c peroxidase [Cryomorphaceae bacterium]|nr:cytochrome-c peroxidase [Cryomorphaceae bacterium]
MKYVLAVFVVLTIVLSCRKDRIGYMPTPYELQIPSHFPDMIIPEDNPMTVEGVALGRRLFYEEKLSGDNSMSCASCHAPVNSFSDPNQFSTGIQGIQGNRNSMALINLGWQKFFFWDGRSKSLEDQILEPIPNPIEMHQSWKDAVAKLNNDVSYRNMFFKAFGEEGVDSLKVTKAIAQFIRTMISGNSKFDVMYKYENGMSLTAVDQQILPNILAEEWAGYDLFKSLNGADCLHCHSGVLMHINKFSNNGLDATFTDSGRGGVTGNPNDMGRFKIPTLRNIELTAPYMHDGRFATLDEVIEHYSSGLVSSPTIDPLMEHLSNSGVQLDNQERFLLKKFLITLTDQSFVNNPDFQDPGY